MALLCVLGGCYRTSPADTGVVGDSPLLTDSLSPGDSDESVVTADSPPEEESLPVDDSSADSVPEDSPTPLPRPNLLVIVVDVLGVDKVGVYADDFPGYREEAQHLPATPTMDRMAAAGLRFSTAWGNPTCAPTRAALQTGRYGFRTGVGAVAPFGPPLGTGETTFADALSTAGYATALFGKWHLGTEGTAGTVDWTLAAGQESRTLAEEPHPLRFGWEYFDGSLAGSPEDYHEWYRVIGVPGEDATVTLETGYATDVNTTAAIDWITAAPEPWLAMVAYNAPHTDDVGFSYELDDIDAACPAQPAAETDLDIYAALVTCLDDRIDRLLKGIPAEDLANTMVVLVGDNGTEQTVLEGMFLLEGMDEYGKGSVYESGVRIPLVIASGQRIQEIAACEASGEVNCPSLDTRVANPGRVVSTPVSIVDLPATLATLGEASLPSAEDAIDFSGCLDGGPCDGRHVLYAETFSYLDAENLDWAFGAVRIGNNKLMVELNESGLCFDYRQYDVEADPHELVDLCAASPEMLEILDAELQAVGPTWLSGLPRCE